MKAAVIFAATLILVQYAIAQLSPESRASTVRQIYDINPDGSYAFAFETDNQIFVEEQGYLKDKNTQVKQGQYQYTAPDGQIIKVFYIADENGFQPQGTHIPVAG